MAFFSPGEQPGGPWTSCSTCPRKQESRERTSHSATRLSLGRRKALKKEQKMTAQKRSMRVKLDLCSLQSSVSGSQSWGSRRDIRGKDLALSCERGATSAGLSSVGRSSHPPEPSVIHKVGAGSFTEKLPEQGCTKVAAVGGEGSAQNKTNPVLLLASHKGNWKQCLW